MNFKLFSHLEIIISFLSAIPIWPMNLISCKIVISKDMGRVVGAEAPAPFFPRARHSSGTAKFNISPDNFFVCPPLAAGFSLGNFLTVLNFLLRSCNCFSGWSSSSILYRIPLKRVGGFLKTYKLLMYKLQTKNV